MQPIRFGEIARSVRFACQDSLRRARRAGIALIFATVPITEAAPVISEFMASNTATIADDDGAFSDWVEIHNPDSTPVSLEGWYLTDTATNRTKWQFPAVELP